MLFRSHSGGSIQSIIPISESSGLNYPQLGNGFAPTLPSHPPSLVPPPAMMSVSMVPLPSPPHSAHLVRPSRSSSLSNVYLPSASEVRPKTISAPSRPQTPTASSPEDECDESDGEDHSHSPPSVTYGRNKRARSDDPGSTPGPRPKNGRRSSTTDANEIPTEYRVEVDRIFFDFLSNICSNRECAPLHYHVYAY